MSKTDKGIEFLICDVGLLWRKLYSQHTKKLGLVGIERRILITLAATPKLNQVELATQLEIEPQGLTRILDRLEEKKLIAKEVAPYDRRAKILSLSKQGEAMFDKVTQIGNSIRPAILHDIAKADLQKMQKILSQLKENLISNG